MSAETRELPLRSPLRVFLLALAFFGGGAVLMFWTAATNHRPLRIEHVFLLDPGQADVFYVVIGAVCDAFVALATLVVVTSIGRVRRVIIDANTLTVPRTFGRADVVIPWSDVTAVDTSTVQRQRFVTIRYAGGKAHVSASSLGAPAFDELCTLIAERARLR